MKVQTKDLIDIALDWAVAECLGYHECLVFGRGSVKDRGIAVPTPDKCGYEAALLRHTHDKWQKKCDGYPWAKGQVIWSPSTNWAQGGPIIEWEGIDLYCNVPSSVSEKNKGWSPSWRAKYHRCGVGSEITYGPTPLIAAMRCFCCAKLGDEVEIPQELQPCQQPNP